MVIKRAVADLAWPGEHPIGKRITGGGMDSYWDQPDAWATVIGVVGNVLQRDLTGEPYATFFFSPSQRADRARGGVIVVRARRGEPSALVGTLRQTIRQLDGDVRMALGSAPTDVLGMVMREAMTTVAIGLVVGIVATLALARVLGSLLFEISPADPLAIVGTVLTLLGVAAVASFIPAWRAATIDPLITMRAN